MTAILAASPPRLDACPKCGGQLQATVAVHLSFDTRTGWSHAPSKTHRGEVANLYCENDCAVDGLTLADVVESDGPTFSMLDDAADAACDFVSNRLATDFRPPPRPVALLVRRPDADVDVTLDGDVEIITIDLGRSFDGLPNIVKGLGGAAEAREYVAHWLGEVAHLPESSHVRREVETLADQAKDYIDDAGE